MPCTSTQVFIILSRIRRWVEACWQFQEVTKIQSMSEITPYSIYCIVHHIYYLLHSAPYLLPVLLSFLSLGIVPLKIPRLQWKRNCGYGIYTTFWHQYTMQWLTFNSCDCTCSWSLQNMMIIHEHLKSHFAVHCRVIYRVSITRRCK